MTEQEAWDAIRDHAVDFSDPEWPYRCSICGPLWMADFLSFCPLGRKLTAQWDSTWRCELQEKGLSHGKIAERTLDGKGSIY